MEIRSECFIVEDEEAGDRIDVYLTQKNDKYSRSFYQKVISAAGVQVNGKIIKKAGYSVQLGDEVQIQYPEPVEIRLAAENIPLDFVYQDEDIAVINKPQGMVVHPAVGNYTGTLVNALLYHCRDLSGINSVLRPGIVHRLDKDTSGLIVIAKNDRAHISLAEQIRTKSARRSYIALVENGFSVENGTIETGYGRDKNNRLKMSVYPLPSEKNPNGNIRVAKTNYAVLEKFSGARTYTLVRCDLHTGRTHQIRVHMASLKHPVVGDLVYGTKNQEFQLAGQLLHAECLRIIHPATGEPMEFHASLPTYFEKILKILRGRNKCV